MKRLAVVLAVLSFLALCQASQAVDLQQGWYAWFGGVYLERSNGLGGVYTANWTPTSALGSYDPIEVSLWEQYPSTRKVTILSNTSVASGILFEDSGILSDTTNTYALVYADWETNYDANKMRLQLLRRHSGQADDLIWQQTTSGHLRSNGGNIWNYTSVRPGDQLVFRVVVVPEPMSVVTLTCSMGMLFWQFRRRK